VTAAVVAIRRATDAGILVRLTASPTTGQVRVLAVRKARRGRRYADAPSGPLPERFTDVDLVAAINQAVSLLGARIASAPARGGGRRLPVSALLSRGIAEASR
jgi:hypothetical protein